MKQMGWKCWVLIVVALCILLLGPWSPILPWYRLKYEFHASKSYGIIPLFAETSAGYSLIQSERINYSADEVICLIVSTGFSSDIEEAERFREITLYAEENPVFDITIDIGQAQTVDWDQSQSDWMSQETYWELELPCDEIPAKKLVYRQDIWGNAVTSSLSFTFNVYLRVKDDAPEDWSGSIYIWAHAYGEADRYGNNASGGMRVDYFGCVKTGNEIQLKS